jgi:hypothetical protein
MRGYGLVPLSRQGHIVYHGTMGGLSGRGTMPFEASVRIAADLLGLLTVACWTFLPRAKSALG